MKDEPASDMVSVLKWSFWYRDKKWEENGETKYWVDNWIAKEPDCSYPKNCKEPAKKEKDCKGCHYAKFPGVLEDHLGASGVYAIWENMKEKVKKEGGEKLLILGEFREEMGSFRNKVAKLLNNEFESMKDGQTNGNLHCFTSDIGMAVQFIVSEEEKQRKSRVQCSICRHDNDLYDFQKVADKHEATPYPKATFHKPSDITEVCIKGDAEGMVYLCEEHDTGPQGLFVEHLERFDLFNSEEVPL